MARSTRQQRRARRSQGQPALAGGPPQRPVRPVANGGSEPAPRPERQEREREDRRRGFGFICFIEEAIGELRKVEWPTQNHLVQGTVVVIVACVVMGTYLYFCDQIFNKLVSKVLLGQ